MKNILISIIIGVLTVSCEKQPKAEVKPVEQIEVAVITTQYGDMVVIVDTIMERFFIV